MLKWLRWAWRSKASGYLEPPVCVSRWSRRKVAGNQTFAQIEAGLPGARLVFNTLVEAIRLSERRIGPVDPDFAHELEVRTLGEQLLRLSFSWGLSSAIARTRLAA